MSQTAGDLRALCAFALSAVFPGAAAAQLQFYEGSGYVTEIAAAAPGGSAVLFDAGGDGVLDLAYADGAGKLTIHERFPEQAEPVALAGIAACAASGERLFGLSQGALVEVVPDGGWTTQPAGGGAVAGATLLRSAERPAGARLLVVDQAGKRASVLAPDEGLAALVQVSASPAEGVFHDLAVLDWNGDSSDDLAAVTSAGLRIYDAAGTPMMALPAAPDDAFLHVVRGEDTQWGHDLLVYQYRQAPASPTALLILNAFHSEVLYTDVLRLDGVAVADLDAAPRPELVLARGDHRSALFLRQVETASEALPAFAFDASKVNAIDLGLGESGPPAFPPATAVRDLDGDGDDDVVFADDRGLGLVMTATWFDADDRRAVPANPWATPYLVPTAEGFLFDHQLELVVPEGASAVEVEVWFQPDPADPMLAADPVYAGVVPAADPEQAVTFATDVEGGVYHLMYRPLAPVGSAEPAFPVWVELWSADHDTMAALNVAQPYVYPWTADLSDGPGGVVRRPKIDPGAGSGWTGFW